MHNTRKSGILLHPTSLPGDGGIGSFGSEARRFVDFLSNAGQSLWQVLPLGPVAYGNSPYSCFSAFAGNPLLIDLATLADEGDLPRAVLRTVLPADRVDFPRVEHYKYGALRQAAETFFSGADYARRDEFNSYCETTPWLHNYALFRVVKNACHGKEWRLWPEGIAGRTTAALEEYSHGHGKELDEQKYMQWQFSRQWRALKQYANSRGIGIIGDLPIFVAYDSADVWTEPGLFHLDDQGRPLVVAGVPPDYFSATGQLWGNPLYNWEIIADDGYRWWVDRMRESLNLYDIVRVDHFRGFAAYWEVPADESTAVNGRWVKGPGAALFAALGEALGPLPIIAEDLGVITPDVEVLRDSFAFPGMKILQFAFGSGPDNPYLPHNHVRESVVYTGTHDNDTTCGWFSGLPDKERKCVLDYLNSGGQDIAGDLIRAALVSVADTAVLPLQDLLRLGNSARMNVPGLPRGNWEWRFTADMLQDDFGRWLHTMTALYGRLPREQYS